MKKNDVIGIGKIILLLSILQAALYILKSMIFIFVERTNYSDRMASMAAMCFLTIIFVIISKKRGIILSVFPKKQKILYAFLTIAFVGFLIWTFIINSSGDYKNVLQMIYGIVMTPAYEELIFRGYVWNRLSGIFNREWKVYVITSVLFGLWHLGYIGSVFFRVSSGIYNIMFWKCITGLCFGLVLGVFRAKTKNCYSTMLVHGLMNMFGK